MATDVPFVNLAASSVARESSDISYVPNSEIILNDPSSFQNSCTGREDDIGVVSVSGDVVSYPDVVEGETSVVSNTLDRATTQQDRSEPNDGSVLHDNCKSWTNYLKNFPCFTHEKLENKLTKNNRTMPGKIAPKAYRNMKKGYDLWKEGYVKGIFIKPNTHAKIILCLAKA